MTALLVQRHDGDRWVLTERATGRVIAWMATPLASLDPADEWCEVGHAGEMFHGARGRRICARCMSDTKKARHARRAA